MPFLGVITYASLPHIVLKLVLIERTLLVGQLAELLVGGVYWTGDAEDRRELTRFNLAPTIPMPVTAEFIVGSFTPYMTANHAHLRGMVFGILFGLLGVKRWQ